MSRPVVQSKQGEALRVEIDVSEITIAEQIELEAKIATPEVYKAAKLEVPMVNGQPLDVQVQLLRRDHGWPYLKITSKQSINSNFLDLLIDLRWATGRLLRDVSLSIDDGRSQKTTAPVMPGSADGRGGKSAMPTLKANEEGRIRVKRGDTASELTVGKTPDSVSLEQMLVALLRNNPDAFVEGNVNRMKEGTLLTLPTEQEAKAVSREDARKAIQVQTKDFEAYRAELAARAPGGTVPKVARDAAGKLEAKVQNNNAKANQDKLTLAKPGKKDSAAEEKIAQQREAQDVANRAAELSRNIAELGKIAAAAVGGAVTPASDAASGAGVLAVDVPASAAQANGEWLNELRDNTLTPVGAGSLVAVLVLLGLWRRRAANKDEDDIQGLPPLNVKFNLDLPEHDHSQEPVERAYVHDVRTHVNDTHEHPHDHEHQEDSHAHHDVHATRPTMEMPNISLDLDEPEIDTHSPYQVRIDLANELWNLGQLHTSKALMEEVATEASGVDKEKALKWLAERG
ncbi:FimV family protein [Limnohabitans sp. Jir61]|uniref:type IV pilus assembly protein FimV n=1 Tax=Limnohabitans sp. Jir61 TaxID=1826168 RepID=UPI001304EADE|nr:FimV/HubP family polar landmark protein [Limnohabitans sp. Jir61]